MTEKIILVYLTTLLMDKLLRHIVISIQTSYFLLMVKDGLFKFKDFRIVLIFLAGSGCLVRKISENLGTTPFFFSKMANGSLHIESLLTIIGKTSSTQVIIKI